ncbi:hypothetical protein SISNIDRAFT_465323 [Sistotremastrum niveocremeum HHB9708]|uniref:Large ribosomal subunit protein uL23m n=2 Tax=Sistotremastraceae TaxID=3402574 RepID=A0A164VRP2_9AGAM|nr:hypothetical protein SISNIDRAFT_465323 [Sistotremastrum niveocremeum HHB9708]
MPRIQSHLKDLAKAAATRASSTSSARNALQNTSRLHPVAQAAREASAPMAVKQRREDREKSAFPTLGNAPPRASASPRERKVRKELRERLLGPHAANRSAGEVDEETARRRSRIRGTRTTKVDGETQTAVVGQRIYLPNIIFRLIRNKTLPGQPYNPYEATFRIPNSVTKNDVRSYLLAMYGVETTYIRTDNYFSPLYRNYDRTQKTRRQYTYKRAVVGLVEPFYYPENVNEMSAEDRKTYQREIDQNFAPSQIKDRTKQNIIERTKGRSAGAHYRSGPSLQRGNIIAKIMEKRKEREQRVAEAARFLVAQQGQTSAAAELSTS